MWHATTASPKQLFRTPGRMGDTVVSRGKMLDGQHQKVDISAHTRIAHKGLLQKKTGRGSLLNRPSCSPDEPIGQGTELNFTALNKAPSIAHESTPDSSIDIVIKGNATLRHFYTTPSWPALALCGSFEARRSPLFLNTVGGKKAGEHPCEEHSRPLLVDLFVCLFGFMVFEVSHSQTICILLGMADFLWCLFVYRGLLVFVCLSFTFFIISFALSNVIQSSSILNLRVSWQWIVLSLSCILILHFFKQRLSWTIPEGLAANVSD